MAAPADQRRGRRSLSGQGDSPQLRVRLPDELRAALAERAAAEGITLSELARRILDREAGLRPETRVQLELHKALLVKLLGDLGQVREIAAANIERMRDVVRGPQAHSLLDEWQRLLNNPGPELIQAVLGEDEHSIALRQASPFAGLLTEEERMAAITRARPASDIAKLSGPLGLRLLAHRQEIVAAATARGFTNLRVFGSVARGAEHDGSDVDLLADFPEDFSLFELGRLRDELEQLLGTDVDIVPDANLKRGVAQRVRREAIAL